MAGQITAWDKLVTLLRRGSLQGFVDFSLRENAVQCLVPEFNNAGGAVCVAEIRVGVVNAGVDDGGDDTGTEEVIPLRSRCGYIIRQRRRRCIYE